MVGFLYSLTRLIAYIFGCVLGLGQRLICSILGVSGLGIIAFILPSSAQAQVDPQINCQGRPVTEMSFSNPQLISGTALQVGAIYRFSNVAQNVDSLVEIMGFVNGGTLDSIDNNIGLANYFQPQLNKTTAESAVDFEFRFVNSGTTTPIQLDFAASAYVLNDPTELDRNASGPTPGRNRYEARTFTVAPGIDPTAAQNIATVFYVDDSSFDYRIGGLGPGAQTRFTSLGFNCPNLQTPDIEAEVTEDFGDAPLNNYGATNSTDTGPYDTTLANGDAGDDGINLPILEIGQTAVITAEVIGAGGFLQAWIDWNADGDILDAGEQVATNLPDTDGDGIIQLNINPPSYGEVEDYIVTILAPAPTNLTCPTGFVVANQTGNAGTVITTALNSDLALGAPSASGANANGVSARVNNGNRTLTLQLEDIIPGGSEVTISIARDNNNGNVRVDAALEEAGLAQVSSFNNGPNDILQRITVTAPANGMEFIRFERLGGAIWIDGLSYSRICSPTADITATKSVEVNDPNGLGLYMVPGNEVLYRIIATNSASAGASATDVDISDTLPTNLRFISANTTGFVGGSFGDPDLPTVNQDCEATPCVVRFSGAEVPIGTTAEVIVIAQIK